MEHSETSPRSPSAEDMRSQPASPHLSDHLANERTFLAYLRTAISLITFGITINRFSIFLLESESMPFRAPGRWDLIGLSRIGFGLFVFGLLLLLWAAIHSSRIGRRIEDGTYRPNPRAVWIITVGVLLGGALILIWLIPYHLYK